MLISCGTDDFLVFHLKTPDSNVCQLALNPKEGNKTAYG